MNKDVVREFVRRVFVGGELDLADQYVSPQIVDHGARARLPTGLEGYKMELAAFQSAFPDLKIDYELIVEEGDLVAGLFRLSGTHTGDFAGLPASGNTSDITGMDLARFSEGKIVELWLETDIGAMMAQLGTS